MIPWRERPDGVEMLWKENKGIDRKRPFELASSDEAAQEAPGLRSCKQRGSAIRHDGKEVGAAWNVGSSVVRHGRIVLVSTVDENWGWRNRP